MSYTRLIIPVTTTGTAGAATGTTSVVSDPGLIMSAYVQFAAGQDESSVVVTVADTLRGVNLIASAAGVHDNFEAIYGRDINSGTGATEPYAAGAVYYGTPITVTVDDTNALAPAVTVILLIQND
jgi:hypothetical protein